MVEFPPGSTFDDMKAASEAHEAECPGGPVYVGEPAGRAVVKPRDVVHAIVGEWRRAVARHPGPIRGDHEAIGVIEEEWLELRSALMWGCDQRGDPSDPREEAIQVAAMCLRYLVDHGGLPASAPAVPFVCCPACGLVERRTLAPEWARLVNEERQHIPVVGCGNPWHYASATSAVDDA